jgi:hypothetical protein
VAARDRRADGGQPAVALWRLRGAGLDLVEADQREMWLAPGTEVDAHVDAARGIRLAEGRPLPDDLDPRAWRTLGRPLLPGWYDDWVIFERELLRQRQLHGMEALGRHLVRERRYAEAVEVGLRIVAVDPLRESAAGADRGPPRGGRSRRRPRRLRALPRVDRS